MVVKFQKVHANAKEPFRGSTSAAGYDLCSVRDATIRPGETHKIGTGLILEIPEGYFGAIFARSGLSIKQGLRPANCVGVVDSDYRGQVVVALHNDSDEDRLIHTGDRIAQLVLIPYLAAEFTPSDSLSSTERGEGGFGSTGKN